VSSLIQYNNLYFLTSTIHQWQPLLSTKKHKHIVLDSFSYLVKNQSITIYAFVLLDNHFHLLFEVIPPHSKTRIVHSFLGTTSRKFLSSFTESEKESFKVKRSNKKLQIWKPNSLCVEIRSEKFLIQKLNYIHKNVARAGHNPDTYIYSSWPSYVIGQEKFDFLTLWG